MKRLFILSCLMLAAIHVSAESKYERTKFCDNWFVGAHTGFNSKLTHNTFFTNLNPHASVRVGREFVPAFGLMAEGAFYFNDLQFGRSHTAIKAFDADLLAYLNMITLVRGYTAPRTFDVAIVGGLGVDHQCGTNLKRKNDFVTRIGCDLNYVLDKNAAWRVFLEPALNYNMTHHTSKVRFNPHYAAWQLSVGVTYRFRNSDGTRTFRRKTLAPVQTARKTEFRNTQKSEKSIERLPAEKPVTTETTLRPVPTTTSKVENTSVPMKVTTTVDMRNMLEEQKTQPTTTLPKPTPVDTTRVAVKPVETKTTTTKPATVVPKPTPKPVAAKKPATTQRTTAKATSQAKRPVATTQKAKPAATRPTATAKKTTPVAKKPTSTQVQKKPVVRKPATAAAKKPTATTQKPKAVAQKTPAATQKKPAAAKKPAAQTQKHAVKTQEPVAQTQKPAVQTQKPAAQTQKPTAQTLKPAVQTQKPATAESLPSINLTDESVILDNRNVSLAAVAFYMRNHPRAVLQVIGQASNANAVRTALIRHFGINGSRLIVCEDASAKTVTFKEK